MKYTLNYPVIINDLSFGYNAEEKLLKNITLKVRKGEVIALVGLSGSGKSTLCYCISGIIPLIKAGNLNGEVLIKGVSTKELTISKLACSLGVVFQNPDNQLFSPTVEDEIAFGPENLGLPREEIEVRVTDTLRKVGITEHRFKNPKLLSGGEKQLVAVASVLSLNPEILIFDEVMSQLDNNGKNLIKQLIKKLKEDGKTIIMVEHDFDNLHVADRVKLLSSGRLVDFYGQL